MFYSDRDSFQNYSEKFASVLVVCCLETIESHGQKKIIFGYVSMMSYKRNSEENGKVISNPAEHPQVAGNCTLDLHGVHRA